MAWIRAYIDNADGHARICDFELEAEDFSLGQAQENRGVIYLEDSGMKKLKMKKGEKLAGLAELTFPEQRHEEP